MRTGVEGCGVMVWFDKYTDIASLVLLFGFTIPSLDKLSHVGRQTDQPTYHQHPSTESCTNPGVLGGFRFQLERGLRSRLVSCPAYEPVLREWHSIP